ncbi:hypothetical protein [Polyangium jinanense]|uniref:Uncharacterized protein n=1 Tax=Polyangium jinanense TaxID=2829994 RepID=A0A9X4AUT0_9BACT|nr:hypothetical protein [Polyangium jinanense]MDC3958004.1 hypothetical protein [Polyangium jinanense]MDC3983557.1 hypothetical protein [Polyangium jinanense]
MGAVWMLGATGCNFPDFAPENEVASVRILATRADKPYATPGDTVNLDVLAFDGRKEKAQPMRVFWIPTVCTDPPEGAPYECYPAFAGAFPRGQDLTPLLKEGTSFSLDVPEDVLGMPGPSGPPEPGSVPFYKTLVVFNMACAGHVEYIGARGMGPQAVPFGCFDADRKELGPEDFMFAFSRVFVFPLLPNSNPVIDHLSFDFATIDPNDGITVDHCTMPEIEQCPVKPLDISVPESSQEPDPSYRTADGEMGKERILVDYYITGGQVNSTRLLYDPESGKVGTTAADLRAPLAAGEEMLFAVVRDNRGGLAWLEIPLHVR